jgi:hypothetical protein
MCFFYILCRGRLFVCAYLSVSLFMSISLCTEIKQGLLHLKHITKMLKREGFYVNEILCQNIIFSKHEFSKWRVIFVPFLTLSAKQNFSTPEQKIKNCFDLILLLFANFLSRITNMQSFPPIKLPLM